jgi:phosphoribosylformimino-5-aminoimidazole carboxamide ribotide isomerase
VLIPCIDLQNGRAVQLVHGRQRELTVVDVFGLLHKFSTYPWLHIIDLDAAMGKLGNNRLVRDLCLGARAKYKVKVRVGGGIRSVLRANALIKSGADQIIIGSAAFSEGRVNMRFLSALTKKIDHRKIVIALDTEKGCIVTHGWRRQLNVRPEGVMEQLRPFCAAFLCTDVDREGTMRGANLRYFRELRDATLHPIIAAGGIKTRGEIRSLEKIGMDAAVGMALYKKRLR